MTVINCISVSNVMHTIIDLVRSKQYVWKEIS